MLFDLDNTLLAGDSDYEWTRFLIEKGVVDGAQYEAKNDEFFRHYKAGTLDILQFLEFQLAPLAAHSRDVLDRWHAEFMVLKVRPMIRTPARRLVAQHIDKGSLCAVVTATNSFVTAPIAREFGIAHLIATEPEEIDGRLTGRPAGTPCFREGKVTRTNDWLASQSRRWADFGSTWFYSDSHNDLSLLERVSRPVAVDPDDMLRSIAGNRNWPVISLR